MRENPYCRSARGARLLEQHLQAQQVGPEIVRRLGSDAMASHEGGEPRVLGSSAEEERDDG